MRAALGEGLYLELKECGPKRLNDRKRVEEILRTVAKKVHLVVHDVTLHKFSPFGISGVVVTAHGHLAIHTWPEHRYAAVDIVTWWDTGVDPRVVEDAMVAAFEAKEHLILSVPRGLLNSGRDGGKLPPSSP